MLTVDLLKQNEILKSLDDNVLQAIEKLSANDENAVIARKVRETYDNIDKKVSELSGLNKGISEKTSDFTARAISEAQKTGGDSSTLKGEIETLRTQKQDLERRLKNSAGDEGLKRQLTKLEQAVNDKEKTILDLQGQVQNVAKEYEGKLTKAQEDNLRLGLDYQFEKAITGVKFAKNIPEAAIKASLKAAKQNVLEKGTPEFFDDAAGFKNVRFRDAQGMVINNPENLQNPFTLPELLTKELQSFGIIEEGRVQNGAGTQAGKSAQNNSVSITGAKTKSEASSLIKESLMSQGISTSHPEYQAKFDEAYKTPEIESLPLR